MMKVRPIATQKMMLLFFFLPMCLITHAEQVSVDVAVCNQTDKNITLDTHICVQTKCGCDDIYIYDAINDRCLVNFKKLLKRVTIYNNSRVDILAEEGMAKSIYIEGEQIFKGILISVILFIVCASICVVSACFYCCRINYSDWTLKHDVKAVAKKLKRNYNSKMTAPKRAPLPVASESCNVVVEDAGVFVV